MEYKDVTEIRNHLAEGKVNEGRLVELANQHLAQEDLKGAYPLLTVLGESAQASIHTMMTAGIVAMALTYREQAVAFFEKILSRDASHFDANYNLALIEMSCGELDRARERFNRLIQAYPNQAPLYNDLGVICADLCDLDSAVASWEKALSLDPNYSLARRNAMETMVKGKMINEGKRLLKLNASAPGVSSKSIREIEVWAGRLDEAASQEADRPQPSATTTPRPTIKGKKIAVFAALDTFVKDISAHLAEANEVQTFTSGTIERMSQLLRWADLAWFEWCDNFLIEATKLPKECKIVCRLHSYEAFTDMPSKVDWSKVDSIIYVNDSVRSIVNQSFKIPPPSVVIHNALDTNRFVISPNKAYGKKIASVGYINYKKNPSLLLYCFKKIHRYDPEYTFHIAGQHQDPRIQLYFEHFLSENPLPITFHGWIEDMPGWYADKDFVISTSLFESFHYSIAEGMACGLMPLIHNWFGARSLYPENYLFDDPDGCLELLKKIESRDKAAAALENRQFVCRRYSLPEKLAEISEVLDKLFVEETETVEETAQVPQ